MFSVVACRLASAKVAKDSPKKKEEKVAVKAFFPRFFSGNFFIDFHLISPPHMRYNKLSYKYLDVGDIAI